eukprot:m.69026 g.69026  ORF g.69026 m.69026 type:complete len:321 (-) comp8262_c0_seq2:2380-3342(-)
MQPAMSSFSVAKTRRGRQHLKERDSKVNENPKSILYVHGSKCSQQVQSVFKDLHALTHEQSKIFSRKRDLRPMDQQTELETLSSKQDASLLLVGTNNKKRPNNITISRMFDNRLLDLAELEVTSFKPLSKFKDVSKPAAVSKPCIIFQGHSWDQSPLFKQLKSMLADIFRGPIVNRVNMAGIDRVVVFSADEPSICMRQYTISLKKSGTKLPIVELEECGPAIDFKTGRNAFAADDMMKEALRRPKQLKKKKVKNVEYNEMGDKTGRIHMQKQEILSMQLRKVKALKPSKEEKSIAKKGKRSAASAENGNRSKKSKRGKK